MTATLESAAIEHARTDDPGWIGAIVIDVRREADAVVSVGLRTRGEDPVARSHAGSHIDLSVGGCAVRQYSLVPATGDETWRIAVLEEPASRGTSRYIHHQLAVGEAVGVRGPRNHFTLRPAPAYCFLAGGIGVTPLYAMIAELEERGHRDWRLLYGGRDSDSMAYAAELAHYGDRTTLWPQDKRGLPDIGAFVNDGPADAPVYCCGPVGLIDAAVEAVDAHRLVIERFAPQTTDDSAPRAAFNVVLAQSGVEVTVEPNQNILDAAEAAGVFLPNSCREGTCGACLVPVLDGVPEHRDSLLTDDERRANDVIVTCSSRAKTARLVLDC